MKVITEEETRRDVRERVRKVRETYEKYINQGLLGQQKAEEICSSLEKDFYELSKLQYKIKL